MKKVIYIMIFVSVVLTLCSCGRKNSSSAERGKASYIVKTSYIVDIMLSHTPVKDQGKTQACWIYAYLACVETERIEQFGDSMNLSPMWLVRQMLKQQAEERYLSYGNKKISIRGIGPEAELLLQKYGMVPYGNFKPSEEVKSSVVERSLTRQVDIAIQAKKGLKYLNKFVEPTLPTLPHNLEGGFYLYSMHYTPMQFGMSLLDGVDFNWYTSYTHHPFGEAFDLEVPDNRRHLEMMNIPIDSLLKKTISALEHHHPVYWEGCMVQDSRFLRYSGCPSIMLRNHSGEQVRSKVQRSQIQAQRQKAFESFEVTDDHAMEIIGLAHDRKGTRYFICKNSWGKEWGNAGLCFMSFSMFLRNTMIIGVPGQP